MSGKEHALTIPQGELKASLCLIISLQVLIHKAESSSALNLCTIRNSVDDEVFHRSNQHTSDNRTYMITRPSVCIKHPPPFTHSIIYECTYEMQSQWHTRCNLHPTLRLDQQREGKFTVAEKVKVVFAKTIAFSAINVLLVVMGMK